MADDDPSREELRRLDERLEQIERLLRTHTERLYDIELRLGIDFTPERPPAVHAKTPTQPPQPFTTHPPTPSATSPSAASPSAAAPPPVTHAPTDGGARASSEGATTLDDAAPAAGLAREDVGRVGDGARGEDVGRERPRGASQGRPYESPYGGRAGAGAESASGGAGAAEASGGTISGAAAAPRRRVRDVEALVGGSWFNWAGILAIIFGVAFFLKLAFDNNWLGPGARVALGAAAGLGIIALAEFLRGRGLRQYAAVLTGGGLLILYLSVYAARAFYGLVGQPAAFLLMCGVTAAAVTLAVRHDVMAVAILGLVGGFLTPLLLSTGQDNQVALFTYVALLDAGVLAVAYFERWRLLNFLAFFATAAMTVGWMDRFYVSAKLGPTVLFLTLFFLLFNALAPVHNVLRRRPARWFDVLLVIANATFYYALAYTLLDEAGYDRALGLFTLSASALYAALFLLTWRRHPEDRLLAYSYVGAAVTFLTTAAAVQFEQHWVTVAWATEGLMLVWVGLRARESAARHFALPVFGFAVAHWLASDLRDFAFVAGAADAFVPLINRRAFSCAVLVAALLGAAWLYRRARGEAGEDERLTAGTFYVLAAAALGLTLLTRDLNDYFHQRLFLAAEDDPTRRRALDGARQFSVAALWTLYGTAALVSGLLRRLRLLRYGALLLLFAAAVRVAWLGLSTYAAPWQTPFLNQTFLAFLLLAAALALCARFYARTDYAPDGERAAATPALLLVANLLALSALSVEAAGHFDRMAAALPEAEGTGRPADAALRDLRLARGLTLSLVWAVYGGVMLAYGHLRRSRLPRLMGLALLGLTTLKVFFLDLSALDRVYRIISFVVLGLILLAVSYLYQKIQRAAAAEEDEGPRREQRP